MNPGFSSPYAWPNPNKEPREEIRAGTARALRVVGDSLALKPHPPSAVPQWLPTISSRR
jgi:hypothetical protein